MVRARVVKSGRLPGGVMVGLDEKVALDVEKTQRGTRGGCFSGRLYQLPQ